MFSKTFAAVLGLCLYSANCDVYFHTPRGSNDRLNENTRNRKNDKRLFDSQNNNRGGYNVGPQPMSYYAGSKLQIEWTNQHSCSNENNNCELVLQYMCGPNVRDGTTTDTIKLNPADCANKDCNTDTQYGMHEDFDYYAQCLMRQRNMGLFTADQNMNGNRKTAVSTRQDNNGRNNRYGYECTEERDYYPYWHTSPWKDIAILTNNVDRCQFYKSESANVKSRWQCMFQTDKLQEMYKNNVPYIPNNKEECESFTYPPNDPNGVRGEWKELPAHGLPAPECRETQFTRDNHLGNGLDGNPNRFNWTLPNIDEEKCVLRIRYNISTKDYDGWSTDASKNSDKPGEATKLDLSQKYGFQNSEQAQGRGYVFNGNPNVKIFDEGDFAFQLAIDTSQFGRTFQDRWNGADTNPQNNDGQGQKGTDRNNALSLRDKNYPEGTGVQYGPALTHGHYGNNYPANISQSQFLGLSQEDLLKLAFLDPASPYFDLGPRKVTQLGTYHYVSTRNNDFSNRDQKARIMVTDMAFTENAVGTLGGDIVLPHGLGTVHIDEGVFDGLHMMRLEVWPRGQGGVKVTAARNNLQAGEDFASDFLVLYPESKLAQAEKYMTVSLKIDGDASNVGMYHTSSKNGFTTWTKVHSNIDGDFAHFKASSGGVYVAKSHSHTVLIVALVVSISVMLGIVFGGVLYFRKNPTKWKKLKSETQNLKKNFNDNI
ncbi:DD3-like protein [Mya arenaria]|uniref:DD3-like protein n=1 Tax=Mya arenaria TaxID=6604 RepID=A0ABY7FSE8_MYAAR|nr:DD3-like protein [Mya arenaria]